jgi:hypothetical protein
MIRTQEDLYDRLSSELAWRKRELGAIKSLVRSRSFSDRKQKAVIRSGITVLYAHWEGYVRAASSAYLEFVRARRLRYEQLAINFVALGSKKEIYKRAASKKPREWNMVAEFFLDGMSSRCSLPKSLDTGANLNSSILRDVVSALGLNYDLFSSSEKLIDERLVRNRNSIAHGDHLVIEKSSFIELLDRVISLMEVFRNEIDNSVTQRRYRRNP